MTKAKTPAAPKLRNVKSFEEAETYLHELMPRTPRHGFRDLRLECSVTLEHEAGKRGRSVSYRAWTYSPKHREVKATTPNELVRMVVAVLFPLLTEAPKPKPEPQPETLAIAGEPQRRITFQPPLSQ